MNILITGKNGYIANSIADSLKADESSNYNVELISLRGDEWKKMPFQGYDCIIHTSALVHKNEKGYDYDDYYQVNVELTKQLAEKALKEGVGKFIFLSSMSVFGIENGIICPEKISPDPKSLYGKSKYEAESELMKMFQETDSTLVILRPPMVYGDDTASGIACPGNYAKLKKLAKICPIFPKIKNNRSMIRIDNLCLEIKKQICDSNQGNIKVIHPQNPEYISTSDLVKQIAESAGRVCLIVPGFDAIIKIFGRYNGTVNKISGNLVYSQETE